MVLVGPHCIYHSGDTIRYSGMEERLRPFQIDLALLPINGRAPERRVSGNLSGPEAAQLAHAIGARWVLPCHYEMFAFNTATPERSSLNARNWVSHTRCCAPESAGNFPRRDANSFTLNNIASGARRQLCLVSRAAHQMKKLKVVGLNFEHMHMGDLLRMCHEHPGVEIAGICDEEPARMQAVDRAISDPAGTSFHRPAPVPGGDGAGLRRALPRHGATRANMSNSWRRYRVHMLVEKPFAATLAEADRMIAAARKARRLLAINWPLRWVPGLVTAHRLIGEGRIGALQEFHHYGGNRGPLWHGADKIENDTDRRR